MKIEKLSMFKRCRIVVLCLYALIGCRSNEVSTLAVNNNAETGGDLNGAQTQMNEKSEYDISVF